MQLNIGIIAATIPTLKPLLKKAGLSTSENRYNQFDDNGRFNATIGSGGGGGIRSGGPNEPGYELDYEMAKDTRSLDAYRSEEHGRAAEIYSGRAGSEEAILCRTRGGGEAKGITCTTEVFVGHGESGERERRYVKSAARDSGLPHAL